MTLRVSQILAAVNRVRLLAGAILVNSVVAPHPPITSPPRPV